jgi:plasmid stabilization system protein ParE
MQEKHFNIELSDNAERDFENSYNYYEKISYKIANDFFLQIDKSLEGIKMMPLSFPIIFKKTRKFVVKKFPFIIYFQIAGRTVQILAIFHTSRNPVDWYR